MINKITPAQKKSFRHEFYQNGLYIPSRKIILGTSLINETDEIDFMSTVDLLKSLLILEEESKEEPVTIYLCTSGGDVYYAFAIYDIIKNCPFDVEIIAFGKCMSAGTIILQAADTRSCYSSTTFMIHGTDLTFTEEVLKAKDLEIESSESKRVNEMMLNIYLKDMKKSKRILKQMMEKDTFVDAQTAKKIGLIDNIY